MVIAAQEEIWRRTFNISCSNMSRSLLGLRYVDNRLWLSERLFEQLPGIRLLLNNYFYGGSITLEEEPAFEFVGFTLDFEQRRILYSRACTTHDIPSTKSAAPQPVLLSGVLARAHTIKKCSTPEHKLSWISAICGTSPNSEAYLFIHLISILSFGSSPDQRATL